MLWVQGNVSCQLPSSFSRETPRLVSWRDTPIGQSIKSSRRLARAGQVQRWCGAFLQPQWLRQATASLSGSTHHSLKSLANTCSHRLPLGIYIHPHRSPHLHPPACVHRPLPDTQVHTYACECTCPTQAHMCTCTVIPLSVCACAAGTPSCSLLHTHTQNQ